MAVILGSARIDERGQASGGAAGDQTGKEVATENFYMHSQGWYCLRAKDDAVANALAEAMKQACANNNIGYDQGQRTNVLTQLAKYGTLAKIAVKTECDCSSLVRACCIQAGFDPANFTTYNEVSKLEATGKFQAKIAVTKTTELFTGDILVTKTKGHTVIVTEGSARGAVKAPSVSTTDKKPVAWVGEITTSLLNIRKQPVVQAGNNLTSYPTLPKGYKVDVISEKNGWLYIGIDGDKGYKYGYASAKYIKKV